MAGENTTSCNFLLKAYASRRVTQRAGWNNVFYKISLRGWPKVGTLPKLGPLEGEVEARGAS